jgi:hypothetical protein
MATTHRFEPATYHLTLGQHDPVLRIQPGDTVVEADASGPENGGQFRTIGILQGVAPFAITSANFVQSVTPLVSPNHAPQAQDDKTITLAEETVQIAPDTENIDPGLFNDKTHGSGATYEGQ